MASADNSTYSYNSETFNQVFEFSRNFAVHTTRFNTPIKLSKICAELRFSSENNNNWRLAINIFFSFIIYSYTQKLKPQTKGRRSVFLE